MKTEGQYDLPFFYKIIFNKYKVNYLWITD